MNDKVFVDTNVWVYAKIKGAEKDKHQKAIQFLQNLTEHVFISTQVVNEIYNALLKNNINDVVIQDAIGQILPEVEISIITIATIKQAWKLKEKYGFSLYDSLIISSALESKCSVLYSEDMQHDQLINNVLRIINPFIIV